MGSTQRKRDFLYESGSLCSAKEKNVSSFSEIPPRVFATSARGAQSEHPACADHAVPIERIHETDRCNGGATEEGQEGGRAEPSSRAASRCVHHLWPPRRLQDRGRTVPVARARDKSGGRARDRCGVGEGAAPSGQGAPVRKPLQVRRPPRQVARRAVCCVRISRGGLARRP